MEGHEVTEEGSWKADLCWGLLFHLQGRQGEAENRLNKVIINRRTPKPVKDTCDSLMSYAAFNPALLLDYAERVRRAQVLEGIMTGLQEILLPKTMPRSPKLALECRRDPATGESTDSEQDGFSRDAFKRIDGELARDIALAAVVYLVRGYASFFSRGRDNRDFNAAKVALNDFFQCGQLAWRLYRSLTISHSEEGNQRVYIGKVINGGDATGEPEGTPYFIWSVLTILDIQRGNVLRQTDHVDDSARFYRHLHRRMERLEKEYQSSLLMDKGIKWGLRWDKFITTTVIKALSEMSKVQFDLGCFLEALMNQNLALAYLVKGTKPLSHIADERKKVALLTDLSKVVELMDCERRQSVLDGDLIRGVYNHPDGLPRVPRTIDPILPERFKGLVEDRHLEFAVDILVRIGFTLFTVCRSVEDRSLDRDKLRDWLRSFFSAHTTLKVPGGRDIQPSRLGQYCLTLIGDQPDVPIEWESVERYFAQKVRETVDQNAPYESNLSEKRFYKAILTATTSNIMNVATIPRRNQRILMRHGYFFRRGVGDLSKDTVQDGVKARERPPHPPPMPGGKVREKFIVLKRWQSLNPRIPRLGRRRLRGGGYFLAWHGKGIVIDPGYDFIQNFYDEGFSLEDVNAVVVTHSHPDHDDDLSTLTTLVREWNAYNDLVGRRRLDDGPKKIDFFLNESANLKFSAWLKASGVQIGRVVPLPTLWWDKDAERPSEGELRGAPVRIDLRDPVDPRKGYSLEMEIIPAWHDDVIGKTEAVGIKFHLYNPLSKNQRPLRLGYTSDTGAYGLDMAGGRQLKCDKRVEDFYADCDVLVAHLGDIKIRELATLTGMSGTKHPIQTLFNDWFHSPDHASVNPRKVRDFFRFLVGLDLVPLESLQTELELSRGERYSVRALIVDKLSLRRDFSQNKINALASILRDQIKDATKRTFEALKLQDLDPGTREAIEDLINLRANQAIGSRPNTSEVSDQGIAWALLGYVCGFSMLPWHYPYHLGVFGLYRLFSSMVEYWRDKQKEGGRIFIIGELPEELSSYRHQVARRLNSIAGNLTEPTPIETKRFVHAFTGDIGMHICVGDNDGKMLPKVRCGFCDHNNETVLRGGNYHVPSKIRETPIKRLDSAMVYLCTEYDHHQRRFHSQPHTHIIRSH